MKKIDSFFENISTFIVEKILKNKFILMVFLFLIVNASYFFVYRDLLISNGLYNNDYKYLFLLILLVLTFTFIYFYIVSKRNDGKIEKLYLLIIIPLSLLYIFFSPMLSQSDETFHFERVYQISEGKFLAPFDAKNNDSSDMLPSSIFKTFYNDNDRYPEYRNYNDNFSTLKIKLQPTVKEKREVRCFGYIFLSYLPSLPGVFLGRILNFSPVLITLLGRITSAMVCIWIFYYSLKRIPYGKKAVLLLLISPTVIAYMCAVSSDGIITAIVALFMSLLLDYHSKPREIARKDYAVFIIILLFISLCKNAYLPFLLLIFLLPNKAFKSLKNKYLFSFGYIFVGFLLCLMWIKYYSLLDVSFYNDYGIKKYFRFMQLLPYTLSDEFVSYFDNMIAGNFLYQARVSVYSFIPIVYYILILISGTMNNIKNKFTNFNKLCIIVSGILIILLIEYAMFNGNTPPNYNNIVGVQGRYFIPILFTCVPLLNIKTNYKFNYAIIISVACLLNLLVLMKMFITFII